MFPAGEPQGLAREISAAPARMHAGGTTGQGTAGTSAGSSGTAGAGQFGGSVGTAGSGSAGTTALGGPVLASPAPGMAGSGTAGGGAGTSGSGGTAATALGPELTDLSTFTSTSCAIAPTVTLATGVPTVGIATFTTDLAGAERAVVQFGKTTSYTLEAPVKWSAAGHRTLLLGMPANTTVHYRIAVIAGRNACASADATYTTGTVTGAPEQSDAARRGRAPWPPRPGSSSPRTEPSRTSSTTRARWCGPTSSR